MWMLVLEAACLGSFVSFDLVLFFVFFELTLVPVYFVIAGWGFERRSAAAVKFFLYTFFGSAFMLVGIVVLAVLHDQQTGKLTFDLVALSSNAPGPHGAGADVPRIHCGVRGEGPAVPLPHLVTRRLRAGSHGWLRGAGWQ